MARVQSTLDHLSCVSSEGHLVEYYDTAQECLSVIRKYMHSQTAPPFDVLIIDSDLPDLDGLELSKRVRGIYPDQRIVVISGDIPDTTYRILREFEMPIQVFRKPVSSRQLLQSLYDGGMYDELRKFKSEAGRIRNSAEIRKS